MDLCLYNNIMTAMSLDGKAFTYVNQLGSSEADKSSREEWFWCACCPPNYSRLFGSLGGYLWDHGVDAETAYINVHLYTSATLSFSTPTGTVSLQQRSDWPWDGAVSFTLTSTSESAVTVTLRLRIPAWANGEFTLSPPLPASSSATSKTPRLEKGYLTLPPSYTSAHPSFTLTISGFAPRWLAPHPYTSTTSVFLARGPLVYCAEDAQNPWETNHFRDVVVKPGRTAVVEEERMWEGNIDGKAEKEKYIALKTRAWKRDMSRWAVGGGGVREVDSRTEEDEGDGLLLGEEREILYVPYYLRANSGGGNGHMRVGMQRG